MINQQMEKDSQSLESAIYEPHHNKIESDLAPDNAQGNESKQERKELLKQLLSLMKLTQTLQTFQDEDKSERTVSNPEHSATKPSASLHQQMDTEYIQTLLRESTDLSTILKHLQSAYSPQPSPSNNNTRQTLTHLLQSSFTQKHTATIPVFKALDLTLEEKEVLFVDISESQQVCLFDSDNFLHVIEHTATIRSCKIAKTLTVLALKWISPQKLLIGTQSNQFVVYSKTLKVLRRFQQEQTQLTFMQIHPPTPLQQTAIVITRNSNHEVAVSKINQNNQAENQHRFGWKQQITYTAVLTIDYYQENAKKFHCRHYYALTNNTSIVKFDTQVKQAGEVWKTETGTVIMMVASHCTAYLHLILANDTHQPIYHNSKNQHCNYQFVKLNGNGSTLTRLPLNLKGNLTGERMQYVANLHPDWLCCTICNNNLLYFSLRTGNTVYLQQLEQPKRGRYHLQTSGPRNCLMLQTPKGMRLLSVVEQEKKEVVINCSISEPRDEIIRRFSLIQGLPENLQLLLQSIRNNEL